MREWTYEAYLLQQKNAPSNKDKDAVIIGKWSHVVIRVIIILIINVYIALFFEITQSAVLHIHIVDHS